MEEKNTKLDDLKSELIQLDDDIKLLSTRKKQVQASILSEIKEDLEEGKAIKSSRFGTFKMHGLHLNVPKKVSWDQDELKALYKSMLEEKGHEFANAHIDVKFSVSESSYKSYSKVLRELLEPARTTSEGSTSIKILKDE